MGAQLKLIRSLLRWLGSRLVAVAHQLLGQYRRSTNSSFDLLALEVCDAVRRVVHYYQLCVVSLWKAVLAVV